MSKIYTMTEEEFKHLDYLLTNCYEFAEGMGSEEVCKSIREFDEQVFKKVAKQKGAANITDADYGTIVSRVVLAHGYMRDQQSEYEFKDSRHEDAFRELSAAVSVIERVEKENKEEQR